MKKTEYYIIVICFIFLFEGFVFAVKAQVYENIQLQIDRSIYIAGEDILISANLIADDLHHLSKVLYVEVFDDNKNVLAQKKIGVNDNGLGQGFIALPNSLSTQNYIIRVYTNYLKSYPPEFYPSKLITVVNPEIPISTTDKFQIDTQKAISLPHHVDSAMNQKLSCTIKKNIYAPREKVQISIKGKSNFKNVSIAVVKKGTSLSSNLIGTDNNNEVLLTSKQNNHYYQELIGPVISGTIATENGNPIKNTRMYLSVFDGKEQIHSTFSDTAGRFEFVLYPETFGINRMVVRKDPKDTVPCKILLDYDYSNKFPEISTSINLDSSDRILLEELYVNHQITESAKKCQSVSIPKIDTSYSMFGKFEISVQLEDFINLPNLKEVFDEIVPYISVKQKNKEPYLSVFNEIRSQYYNSPLVLVDFVPVFNIEELLKIKPESLKKIEVINRAYQLGGFTYHGIVNIHSKTSNLADYSFPKDVVFFDFEGVSYPYNHKTIDYKTKDEIQSRIPDFRTVLYWNPQIKKDTIFFYTSDHCSDYQIIIKGIDHKGDIMQFSEFISVKN